MRIARLTDYAFILLTALGRQTQASTTILAKQSGLSEATVAKVLKNLAQAGLVQSARGANGGYALTKPADQINLATVIEAMEGPIALTKCTHDEEHVCHLHCGRKAEWSDVNGIVRDALAGITLAQMEGLAS